MARLTLEDIGGVHPCSLCGVSSWCSSKFVDTCPVYLMYKKLHEYEDIESEGRLHKFICGLGTTVYVLNGGTYTVMTVDSIAVESETLGDTAYLLRDDTECLHKYYSRDFGSTVFLNEEVVKSILSRNICLGEV